MDIKSAASIWKISALLGSERDHLGSRPVRTVRMCLSAWHRNRFWDVSNSNSQGQGSKQVLIGNAKTSPILRGCTVDSLANAKGTGNHVWVTDKKWQKTLYIRIRFALRGHASTSFKTWKTSWCSPICSLCSHILSIYTCSYLHSRQLQENTLVMVWWALYWNLHYSRRIQEISNRTHWTDP